MSVWMDVWVVERGGVLTCGEDGHRDPDGAQEGQSHGGCHLAAPQRLGGQTGGEEVQQALWQRGWGKGEDAAAWRRRTAGGGRRAAGGGSAAPCASSLGWQTGPRSCSGKQWGQRTALPAPRILTIYRVRSRFQGAMVRVISK